MNTQFKFAFRMFALLASLTLAVPLVGQAQKSAQRDVQYKAGTEQDVQNGNTLLRVVPMIPQTGQKSKATIGPIVQGGPQGAQLSYYGGPVISNVQVVVVFWGPNVDASVTSGIAGYYQAITNSTYFDLLSEYSTAGATVTGGAPSSNQKIGRGTYLNSYTITPSVCPSNCTIDDSQIGPEILAQINAGHLPQPTQDANGYNNTLYMTYFPPGVTITLQGSTSCQQFCGYHMTVTLDSRDLGYGVIPDFSPGSGCDLGCGSGTQFEDVTAVSSHELAESVTDMGVGLAGNNLAPPLAWYDNNNGEIGDICNGMDTTAVGYSVQLLWSNMQNGCVDAPAQLPVTAPSTATAGTPVTVTVTAQDNTGATLTAYTGTVHFTSTDAAATLPADYTFVSADNGTHTFNVTLQTSGSQSVTATDSVAAAVTGVSGAITVSGGTGGGGVSLTPSSLSFGNQTVGSTSAPQTTTLTNGGTSTLSITNISASGDFAATSSCGASLAASASCTISVTFTPTAAGSRTGTLTVTDNASGGSQTASLSGTGATMGTDHLVLITSQASQGANDSVTWSQLGADGTLLQASLSARSVNGLAVTGSLAGPNSVPSVVCSASVCSWTGTGFPAGDTLVWTSDAANGGNGPLTLGFGSGISGGGVLIQADAPGQFTAQIQAYNSSTLLGTFTVPSDTNGDPAYIGVQDSTGPNITSLTFSLTNCVSTCTDFAIDTAYLNQSGTSNTFPLTVAVSGSGSGTVTSTPAGISCPGTCTANFNSGTSVTLNESAAAGSTFGGWSGACTGTGACSVGMTSAQSVTATFQQPTQTQTNTTLTVSSAQANVGSSVTFTAKVAPVSGNTMPTGTVTFNNGSTALGAIQLVSGTATFTTNTLVVGSYSVTAAYGGDTNSASSSSAAVALIVGDVNVTASPMSLTVSAGQSVTTTLTVTPSPTTGFSPTVTFSCSGLPAQSTCTFTPTSVTPGGAAATTTLSIQTAPNSSCVKLASVSGHGSGWIYALFVPGLIGVLSLKRKQLILSTRFLGVVAVLALLTISMGWTACSSVPSVCTSGSNSGTPTGTSNVTVTATSSGSNPISKQVTIALTVQ